MNRVGAYVLYSVLDGRGLGEEAHRALGRAVGAAGAAAHQAGGGRDVDDRTAARLAHLGDGQLGAEKHTFGVDVQDQVPLLARGLQHVTAPPDGGVVDQHVQLAVGSHGGRDRLLPVVLAGHIQVDVSGVAAQLVDFRCNGHAIGVQHIGYDHLGALAGKQLCFSGTLAP